MVVRRLLVGAAPAPPAIADRTPLSLADADEHARALEDQWMEGLTGQNEAQAEPGQSPLVRSFVGSEADALLCASQ